MPCSLHTFLQSPAQEHHSRGHRRGEKCQSPWHLLVWSCKGNSMACKACPEMQLLWITTLGHKWQRLKLEALIAGASVGKLKPNPACCLSVYDLWVPPEQPRTGSCEDQARVSLSAHFPTLFPVPASSDWWPCLQLPSWHLYVGDSTTGNCYTLSSGIFRPEVSNSLLNCLTSSQLPKLK